MNRTLHSRTPLLSALLDYTGRDITPFDVPGHKRGRLKNDFSAAVGDAVMRLDINSTKEMDLLDKPTGVIKEAEALLADAWDADYAYFLVNGSTFGVQAMMLAACPPGSKIILPRNIHKSAVNGLILSGAVPVFIQPEIDAKWGISHGVSVESVRHALAEHPDARAILLINPTYFGAVSDLKTIVTLAHRHHVAVLVDEAHGAHFPFHRSFPHSAMESGADLATVSLHKTVGSLTQTSALFLNEGLISHTSVRATISLMQTTSASYLFMASIDAARKKLATEGKELYSRLLPAVHDAKTRIAAIDGYDVLTADDIGRDGLYDYDETKIVVHTGGLGLTGFEVYDRLRAEYNIQVELAETSAILAVTTLGDDENSLNKLVDALADISQRFYGKNPPLSLDLSAALHKPRMVVTPREAYWSVKKEIAIKDAVGEVSGESLMAYPPGIPLVIPGERITKETLEMYEFIIAQHGVVVGTADDEKHVLVLGE